MPEKKTGGPAFPGQGEPLYGPDKGMTLRDYFAGQAVQGMLASVQPDEIIRNTMLAQGAYEIADAMLEERER